MQQQAADYREPRPRASSDDANAKNRRIAVTVSEASRSAKRAAK